MPAAIAAVLVFAAASRGAYDLWAATVVHAAVLALALALLVSRAWPKSGGGLRLDFLPFLAAAAAALGLSALFAANPGDALWRAKDYLAAALLFVLCLTALRSEDSSRALPALLVPLFWAQGALILYQRYDSIFAQWRAPFPPGWDGRTFFYALSAQVGGTMLNSNVMAAFLLLWIPALLARGLEPRRSRGLEAWYWRSGLAAAAASLLLLNGAWALLCALAAAPFALGPERALTWARRRPRKALGALCAAAVLLGLVLWWKFLAPFDWSGAPVSPTARLDRWPWWDASWRMFLEHPWSGVGPGGFSSAYLAYKTGPGPGTHFAHNLPAGLLAELGLPGFAAFAALAAAWGLRCARAWEETRSRWPYMLGAASFLLCSLLQPGLEYPANLLSLAVCLGAAAAPAARRTWKPARPAVVLLAAAAFAALPFVVSPLMASRAAAYGAERLAAGEDESALRAYETAIELDGLSAPANRGAAHALLARHRRTKAAGDLAWAEARQARAASLDRLNGQQWWELGRLRVLLSDKSGAAAAFREAARRRPTSAQFQKDLELYGP